jgi:hypothetical protein
MTDQQIAVLIKAVDPSAADLMVLRSVCQRYPTTLVRNVNYKIGKHLVKFPLRVSLRCVARAVSIVEASPARAGQ